MSDLPTLPNGYEWDRKRGFYKTDPPAQCARCGEFELQGYHHSALLGSGKTWIKCGNCGIKQEFDNE